MSSDPTPERNAVRLWVGVGSPPEKLAIVSGRVFDSVPDATQLAFDQNNVIRPYIIITFGTPYPKAGDRSIEGAEQQPLIQSGTAECWAATREQSEAVMGAVITRLRGFSPSENNAGEIELRGGGSFRSKESSGRPSRFMESVNFEFDFNLSVEID